MNKQENTIRQLKRLAIVMAVIVILFALQPLVFHYQSYDPADSAVLASFGVVVSLWILIIFGVYKGISYVRYSTTQAVVTHQAALPTIAVEREKLWFWRFSTLVILAVPLIAFAIGNAMGGALLGFLMAGTSLWTVRSVWSTGKEAKQSSQVKIAEVKAYKEKEDREIVPQCPLD